MVSERKRIGVAKSNYILQLKIRMEQAREELNSLFESSGSLSSPEILKSTRKFDRLHVKFLRATRVDRNIDNKKIKNAGC